MRPESPGSTRRDGAVLPPVKLAGGGGATEAWPDDQPRGSGRTLSDTARARHSKASEANGSMARVGLSTKRTGGGTSPKEQSPRGGSPKGTVAKSSDSISIAKSSDIAVAQAVAQKVANKPTGLAGLTGLARLRGAVGKVRGGARPPVFKSGGHPAVADRKPTIHRVDPELGSTLKLL